MRKTSLLFYLDVEQDQALRQAARRQERTVSGIIREAITDWLAAHNGKAMRYDRTDPRYDASSYESDIEEESNATI